MDKLGAFKDMDEYNRAKEIISQYFINLNGNSETIKNKVNAYLSKNKKDAAV